MFGNRFNEFEILCCCLYKVQDASFPNPISLININSKISQVIVHYRWLLNRAVKLGTMFLGLCQIIQWNANLCK